MGMHNKHIVGISLALNAFAENFHKVSELIKEIYPEALVVAGGHYPSSYPERIHKDKNVDYYVIGEGEIPFKKFVGEVLKDELPADKKLIETYNLSISFEESGQKKSWN